MDVERETHTHILTADIHTRRGLVRWHCWLRTPDYLTWNCAGRARELPLLVGVVMYTRLWRHDDGPAKREVSVITIHVLLLSTATQPPAWVLSSGGNSDKRRRHFPIEGVSLSQRKCVLLSCGQKMSRNYIAGGVTVSLRLVGLTT